MRYCSHPSVHPREVVKIALFKGAAACLAYHNHPSGVEDQSQADEIITQRLRAALALVDVRLIDHVIGRTLAVVSQFIHGCADGISTCVQGADGANQGCSSDHFKTMPGSIRSYAGANPPTTIFSP